MSGVTRSRILPTVFALLAVCAAGGGGAHAAQAPAAGRFLVATPTQRGFFSETVILLIEYGPDGAFGLIVNRPTRLSLAKLLPDVTELQDRTDVLYLGGPVSLDHLTLLIRSKVTPPDAVHVVDDVYASGSVTALQAIVGDRFAGARFRGYAGYAGWAPGQLEREIARGGWRVVTANADLVFSADPSGLWEELIQRKESRLVDAGRPGESVRASFRKFAL